MAVIEKLLKQIGLSSSDISAVIKADQDNEADFNIDEIVTKHKESQRILAENDPDLVEKFASKERGKQLDIITRKLKNEFGLTSDQIKDKKIEEVIGIAKIESQKGSNKDLQTLQDENLLLINKVKEYEEVKIPKIINEIENEKRIFKINNGLSKMIPNNDVLRVPTETAQLIINAKIGELYDLDMDEKGEIIVYNKGSKLQAKSQDGTKLLTANDLVESIAKANKLIKESNADDADTTTTAKKVIQPFKPEDVKKMPIGQQKAIAHAERLAEEAKQRAEAEKKPA